MASFGMSLLAGFLVAALCVQMGYAMDDINNCPTAENCIRYDESGCNSEGERLVCISWQDQSGCQLTPGQDDVEDICKENDVGRPAAVDCAVSNKPDVDFSTDDAPAIGTVAVGDRVTYTCLNPSHVLRINTASRVQFVTCTRDGSFTTPVSECVPVIPVSCADHFSRDNNLATSAIGCQDVTIQPMVGGTVVVQCCKESNIRISTQIPVDPAASSTLPAGDCTMMDTMDAAISGTVTATAGQGGFCGPTVTVAYGALDSRIQDVIGTTATGDCTQTVTNNCLATANSLALAVKQNGVTEGDFYGANIFSSAQIGLSAGFTTDNCDCADVGPVTAGTPCEGGCLCTKVGAVGTAQTDMITLPVTSSSPAYVTAYRVTAHNSQLSPANNGEFSTTVSSIICSETV